MSGEQSGPAELAIRYAKTADGVRIAWGEAGDGPALLHFQGPPFSHAQEAFSSGVAGYRGLARSFRLIMFDARGTGLSERDVADVSATTLVADAEAVIEAAKLGRFVVVTDTGLLSLSTALRLALALPERITHLAFTDPVQSMRDLENSPYGRIGLGLAEADWDMYVQTVFRVLAGFDQGESSWVDLYAKTAAKWVAPGVGLRYTRLQQAMDVGDLLGDITQPTLVLRRSEQNIVPAEACQRVAAAIPGAQFRQYSDPNFERWSELIRDFVVQATPRSTPGAAAASGTAVILFTDIVDSTALTERMGDAAFRELSRALDAGLRGAIREAGGEAIEGKLLGDGVLATFGSAAQAIDGARRCLALSAASELGLHIGLHAGDVIREEGNVFGGAVNIASRICGLSAPGEILVSDVVRGMARSSAGVEFEDRGEQRDQGCWRAGAGVCGAERGTVVEPVSRRTPMDGRAGRGLIACDLDGTLLRSDGTLSPRAVASIRRAEAAGWIFVMVTGRPVRRILHVAEEAGLNGIALCSNGAIVFDLQTHTMVDGHPIEPAIATALVGDLREAIDGVYFAFELGLQFGREDAYPRRMRPIDAAAQVDERVGDALELASSPVHKLIVAHPERDFDRLLLDVTTIAGDRAEVTHSARDFIEVSARGVDKASGTRLLAEQLGIDARNAVAIGDMPNDLPMLAWAGLAVAVGNAHPDVLRAAQRVVAANDDDGVADMLDSLALM